MEDEEKSWYMTIHRGPEEDGEHCVVSVELPGGKTDAGLMESDLTLLASTLKEYTHEDLSQEEIEEAVLAGLRDNYVPMGNVIVKTEVKE